MSLFTDRHDNPRLIVREIFSDNDDPDRAAVEWVNGVARDKGLDPGKDQLVLIREVRRSDRSLGLEVATYLVQAAAAESG